MSLSETYINELLAFSNKHSSTLVRRFLTELISTKELIFDLHDELGRTGLAVLLDKVHNPANDSCLEILGVRAGVNSKELLAAFINLAKKKQTMKRAGFQVGFHQDSTPSEEDLKELGLSHYYDTYEMLQTKHADLHIEAHSEITIATIEDSDEVYKVMSESFSKNPDTSIPDIETWRVGFLKSPKSHFYIWKTNNKIVGFSNLIEADDGSESEIRTLGVLSSARGQGIGKHLLNYSLKQSAKLGFHTCRLTVAVENEKALTMYTQAGFQIVEKFKTFRMNFS